VSSGALAHRRVSSKHDKIELVKDHRLASIQLSHDMGDIFYSPDRESSFLWNIGKNSTRLHGVTSHKVIAHICGAKH
jgi:hypothetical protein